MEKGKGRVELRSELRAVKAERRRIEREHRVAAAALDARVRRLEAAIEGTKRAPAAGRRSRAGADPHVQAGPANLSRAQALVRSLRRPFTQAEVVAQLGINSGTGAWTIKALEQDGVIQPTGESVRRSRVFRYVPPRGRTTLAPGE